jgi:hypothetical protein
VNMPELVYLEWIDSSSNDTWQDLTTYKPGIIYCKSIGWLIREDDLIVSLAGSLASEKEHAVPDVGCGWMDIPKVAIRKRVSLSTVTEE